MTNPTNLAEIILHSLKSTLTVEKASGILKDNNIEATVSQVEDAIDYVKNSRELVSYDPPGEGQVFSVWKNGIIGN